MALATEIAANSGCNIYDALFVALAEYENTVVRLHSSNCAE
jgi:predicted nucleic acid-binding protein